MHAVAARSRCPSQNAQSNVSLGALLEVEMFKKCTPLWREAHFQVKMLKTPHARTTFEGSDLVLRSRRKGFDTLPKTMAGVGHLQRICKDAFSGRRGTRDMFIRDVRRSGR